MADFYIQLISSACSDAYLDNAPYKFVNYLTEPIILPDTNWVVGLTEIQFAHRHKITQPGPEDLGGMFIFDFFAPRGGGTGPDMLYGKWTTLEFDFSDIHTGEELALYLNTLIWRNLPRSRRSRMPPFSFDASMGKLWFTNDPSLYYMFMAKGYCLRFLGLTLEDTSNQIICLGKTKRSMTYKFKGETRNFAADVRKSYTSKCTTRNFFKHPPMTELNNNITEFAIYCSIVSDNVVAGQRVPNLRVVDLDPRNAGKPVTKLFTTPYYFKLATTIINTVTIEFRALSGALLNLGGVSRVVLHIKQM